MQKKLLAEGRGDEEIRLWKLDVKGPYTQLTFKANDVRFMGAELPEDVICSSWAEHLAGALCHSPLTW
jgi:hypothetical protein